MKTTLVRMIAPDWLPKTAPKIIEGLYDSDSISSFNNMGYNIYYFPNGPSTYSKDIESRHVKGSDIDKFDCVFVDYDLKSGDLSKHQFVEKLSLCSFYPTKIVDSGNGVHAYWQVSDLDPMSYLRLCRRLMRELDTDPAVGQILQLMRLPNTMNTKKENEPVRCHILHSNKRVYTCEELHKNLKPITVEDEQHCKQHFDKTYNVKDSDVKVSDELPYKFGELLSKNSDVKRLFSSVSEDRSVDDFKLGALLKAENFTKKEAIQVLMNTVKASQRAPIHRMSYATNIVDKLGIFDNNKQMYSESVEDILSRNNDEDLKGTRFRCYDYIDGTEHGFRLSQVLGLSAGVGTGKTSIALNIFKGFVQNNPEYIHLFVSLEQPAREIALRWKRMCGDNSFLHSKMRVLENYNKDNSYRNLSLTEIQNYVKQYEQDNNCKIGCVCIDHIGILRQEKKPGEYQGLRDIQSQLKAFAMATNTFLVIQTQTTRDKAGDGDLELFKDAAYGGQNFEGFVDYLCVSWQPLKRCYDFPDCPRVTAFKFAKIRSKSAKDKIIEDQCYRLLYEQNTETLRPITQDERRLFRQYASVALTRRQRDRKTDLVEYKYTIGETPDE